MSSANLKWSCDEQEDEEKNPHEKENPSLTVISAKQTLKMKCVSHCICLLLFAELVGG